MRIQTEELGKTEKYREEDVYTHIIFAEKVLNLAKQAKIEGSMSNLWNHWNVRDKLPEVLRENLKVPENQASWTVFVQAIKDVDMGHIREGVRKFKEKADKEACMNADINLLKQRTANAGIGNVNSPTKAIRNQLANTVISQQPTTANKPATADPFNSASRGGGNIFNTRMARPPATEAEKTTSTSSEYGEGTTATAM